MRIAIATDGNFVSQHFGRCPYYTIVEIEGNNLFNKKVIDNPGHQPGFLPQFLKEQGMECMIAGGMGTRAQSLFAEAGIQVVVGVTDSIDDVIKQLLNGTLKGGESLCEHGAGKGYGLDKSECDHPEAKMYHTQNEEKVQSETKTTSGGKICITAQGNNLDSEVDPRFGRCLYFIIIDPQTLEFEAIENPNISAMGGAGIQSAQLIASKGAGIVLTGNVGPNAFKTFEAAGIKIITGISGSIKSVIEKYKKGNLKSADGATVPGHSGINN